MKPEKKKSCFLKYEYRLTHTFSMHPSGFLMFSGAIERVHKERMGNNNSATTNYISGSYS